MSKAIQFKKNGENIYPCPYYPIGAIYMSVSSIDPGTIFGGQWERIKGRFLLSADDGTYKVNNTGGSSTVTLNANQMPWHQHTGNTAGAGNHEHQVALNGDGNYDIWYRLSWGSSHTGYCISGNNTNGQSSGASFPSIAKANGHHAHSFTTDGSGGSQAHDNMPPYLVVYMWKRTK